MDEEREGDGQMKKTIIVLALMMFAAGCAVIDEQLTGPRVRVEPQESYGYTPSYGYMPMYSNYYNPYMWSGWYGWWSPYWLYGYYSPYGSYNPYFWGWYNSPSRARQGNRTIITKDQLSKTSVRTIPGRTVTKSSGRTIRSTGSSRTTGSRSGAGRAISSRSGSSSSSRGSSGTRIKKK